MPLTGNTGLDKFLSDADEKIKAREEAKTEATAQQASEEEEEVVIETEETTEDEQEETSEEQEETNEEEDDNDYLISLDDEEDDTTEEGETIFSGLSEALQTDIKTQDDVVALYKQLQTKNKELEDKLSSTTESVSNIPDVLKRAIEINKQGGDYLSYLDLNAQKKYIEATDAKELFTNYLAQQEFFQSQEDPSAALREYIEDENPTKFRIDADAYKRGLLQQTSTELETKAAKAAENKARALENVKKALDNVNDIYGVKISPKNKQHYFEDFQSGEFTNKLLYDSEGEPDYEKMVRIAFLNDNFEKIMDIVKKGATTQTKRNMISQNANRSTKGGGKVTTKSSENESSVSQAIEIFKTRGGFR